MVWRICEITVTLDFIFWLVHCSSEDVSFNSICLNVLEGIKQFYLLMWFKKTRLETPFKGENVKTLVKTSNCENLVLYFSEKVQKVAAFAMLFFGFQWPNNRLKRVLAPPNDQKYTRYQLFLKLNVTLARPLRLVILYFFTMENRVSWSALVSSWQQMKPEICCGWDHPCKTIAKFIVYSILPNTLNIVCSMHRVSIYEIKRLCHRAYFFIISFFSIWPSF